jgi:selenide,water dikinase
MVINLERRKVVMTRSIKLGHCVCNPRQGCPCDMFKDHNVCPCAGEKLPPASGPVALTQFVRKAGCASKIGQADLKRILSRLPPVTDPNVLLGAAAGDDAGVYRIDERHCLVQTVDVFTPCVDDPYLFGQIAAANSLSDIYAMGGRPLTALSIIGFPIDDLDGSIMEAMLRGGMDKLQEAGCSLIGGHSLQDEEVKCGFAITGLIDPQLTVVRDNARPGDVLVLTKPLGTGMLSFAAQIGRLAPGCLDEAGAYMALLNKDAADLMNRYHAHACTDITGFGLMGHLVEMARNSRVRVELDMSRLPVFAAAVECLEQEVLPGAIERNQEYSMAWVRVADVNHSQNLPILYDPQTSGGLLISLPEAPGLELVKDLQGRGNVSASIIGRITALADSQKEAEVVIVNTSLTNMVGKERGPSVMPRTRSVERPANPRPATAAEPTEKLACCAAPETTPTATVTETAKPAHLPPNSPTRATHDEESPDTADLFMNFLGEANRPGLIDERAKKLMAIALSVAQRCKPCLAVHIKGAQTMGISKAEIDESAWLGIAFAGSPAMMLYREVWREIRESSPKGNA